MSNFDFLKDKKAFEPVYLACIEAEKSLDVSASLCALAARKAVEVAVKWVYKALSYNEPYNTNISNLIHDYQFSDFCPDNLFLQLKFIIKLGNIAAHTDKVIDSGNVLLSLSNLFHFVKFLCSRFDKRAEVVFDSEIYQYTNKKLPKTEFTEKAKQLDESSEAISKSVDNVVATHTIIENKEADQFFDENMSEWATRKKYIDVEIMAAGWNIGKAGACNCVVEVQVNGMPNYEGKGYIDYVLYDDNGKPLAVIEAKRTSRDPEDGRKQAKLYADCLEEMTGQRPLIFYTNGFDYYLWDDVCYPPRQVSGIFTLKDLQKLIKRRYNRNTLDNILINKDIAGGGGRVYQQTAIHRVCEWFSALKRKALIVMATGTGKTRVSIALIEVLARKGWVRNVLFLADRINLVKQAKREFKKYLPDYSTCNLLERDEKDSAPEDARIVFSTYPTMMNAIDDLKGKNGNKAFSNGHFDLIIIDEAHRSIFRKYKAIFKYFDSLLVGLTATPKRDVDRNTYNFFDIENDIPTFAYELDRAISEKFLVNYYNIETTLKIPVEGALYDELSEDEKRNIDEAFGQAGEDSPEEILPSEINQVIFNIDTINKVLEQVMTRGIKVKGGDELGKTIIFAQNKSHAMLIKKQFDKLYPEYKGKFAEVIVSGEQYNHAVYDSFCEKNSYPQIAISVDMLDTGIDVPSIVNLVMFKRVRSVVKFWQMIGRGTRLCENLFGTGEHKKEFYVFDYLSNFEFFRENPQGSLGDSAQSLTERIFNLKVKIIKELQHADYQTEELRIIRNALINEIYNAIISLNRELFSVKGELKYVERYSDLKKFEALNELDIITLKTHISYLIPSYDTDEVAKRFDNLLYKLELASLENEFGVRNSLIREVILIANKLKTKASIPEVNSKIDLIRQISQPKYWENCNHTQMEQIRKDLRELIKYLISDISKKIINISDQILKIEEGNVLSDGNNYEDYYLRASRYIYENMDNPLLYKLNTNQPLNPEEWQELERIFFTELGTYEEFEQYSHTNELGYFIRKIVGLDRDATNKAFAEFLDNSNYSNKQIAFVNRIVEYITENGMLEDKKILLEPEFSSEGTLYDLFGANSINIVAIIDAVNKNAMKAVA